MSEWRNYLHALPDAEAPEALWQRIARARAESVTRRSRPARWLPALGLAAAVALAAVLALPRGAALGPRLPAPVVAATPAESPALRALDDAIALAYARDAAQEELDALWQTRERLLGSPGSEPLLARL